MIDEAMTTATVRVCNNCKTPFWKEGGCNRITCTRCRNQQCFVCSLNLEGVLGHFQDHKPCPLFDDTALRLQNEAATARTNALDQVLPISSSHKTDRQLIPISYRGSVPAEFEVITVDQEQYLRHSDLDFPIPHNDGPILSISKDASLLALYQRIAESFGLEENSFRLWTCACRQNKTIRLNRLIIPHQERTCTLSLKKLIIT